MDIYNIETQPFKMQWGKLTAAFVGSPGAKYRQVLIPVRVDGDDEPEQGRWDIRPSRSGRPLIVGNGVSIATPGLIARITSFDGVAHKMGTVFVCGDDKDKITVIANGMGGDVVSQTSYDEYIVVIHEPCRLRINKTAGRDMEWIWDGEEVTEVPVVNDDVEWITLNDPRVPRWRREEYVPDEDKPGM